MMSKAAEYHLGIDLGGTKIEGIVLDGSLSEIYRKRIDTEQDKGYGPILKRLQQLYGDLAEQIKNQTHTLGIGTPGAISPMSGFLKNSNTICFNERLTKKALKEIFNHDFNIENDANCFALAEAKSGAGKGKKVVFGVIMGTGCGGGLVYEGKVWRGKQAIAGEWGHMSIDPRGPDCYCGSKGCIETFISGSGLEASYQKQYKEKIDLKEIVELYHQGNEQANEFMKQFFRKFGRAMANLINVLDPDIIVLGGGVSNIEELYTEGVKEVRNQIFSDSLETPIVKHTLGDSAGVLGAALIGK